MMIAMFLSRLNMILQIVYKKMLLMFYPDWDWHKNHQFKNDQNLSSLQDAVRKLVFFFALVHPFVM
jgi:hypothetical protein